MPSNGPSPSGKWDGASQASRQIKAGHDGLRLGHIHTPAPGIVGGVGKSGTGTDPHSSGTSTKDACFALAVEETGNQLDTGQSLVDGRRAWQDLRVEDIWEGPEGFQPLATCNLQAPPAGTLGGQASWDGRQRNVQHSTCLPS